MTLHLRADDEFPDLVSGTLEGPDGAVGLWRDVSLATEQRFRLPDGRRLRISAPERRAPWVVMLLVGLPLLLAIALLRQRRVLAWVEDQPVTSEAHPWVLGGWVATWALGWLGTALPPLWIGALGALLWTAWFARRVDALGARSVHPVVDGVRDPGPTTPFDPPAG